MSTNPLRERTKRDEEGSKRSSQEWCDFLNQTRLPQVNADRKKDGFDPVHWVVRNGLVTVEFLRPAASNSSLR
jgi:hypothetical protein